MAEEMSLHTHKITAEILRKWLAVNTFIPVNHNRFFHAMSMVHGKKSIKTEKALQSRRFYWKKKTACLHAL